MKWGVLLGITITVILMTMIEWPKMNQQMKKEKVAFTSLTVMGWILAILLVFYPELPGPTQMVDAIYKPLGKLLEK